MDDEPLSDYKRESLREQPLLPDEWQVLATVVELTKEWGARSFKYLAHERIEAAGIDVTRRKQIIQLLVDRGAICGGWCNVGAPNDPDLMAIYQIASSEAVEILLDQAAIRPGRRVRPSSLAERAAV